jgi:hypothetical protein
MKVTKATKAIKGRSYPFTGKAEIAQFAVKTGDTGLKSGSAPDPTGRKTSDIYGVSA